MVAESRECHWQTIAFAPIPPGRKVIRDADGEGPAAEAEVVGWLTQALVDTDGHPVNGGAVRVIAAICRRFPGDDELKAPEVIAAEDRTWIWL